MKDIIEVIKRIQKSGGLILLIDIDDVLVFSSKVLQFIVNQKTVFKTEVLNMLEQLKRNCKYYSESVEKECNLAYSENRNPNLSKYHIFDGIEFDNNNKYTEPVKIAKDYFKKAEEIYNQFLEERDTFLEIDNLHKGEIIPYNYIKESLKILDLFDMIKAKRTGFHKINSFCCKEVELISNEAKLEYKVPNYGSLVNMDSNDIVIADGNDEASERSVEYYLYEKPVETVNSCLKLEDRIDDIISNARVFFNPCEEIVDYSKIHCEKNFNWPAINFFRKLIATGLFDAAFLASHNTGPREDGVKDFVYIPLIPGLDGYFGDRFHTEEHDGERRGRSSKIDRAAERLGVSPERFVTFDDSFVNCTDCKEKGGLAFLAKAKTDAEKIMGRLIDTGFIRILDFSDQETFDMVVEACKKHKSKINKQNVKCKKL